MRALLNRSVSKSRPTSLMAQFIYTMKGLGKVYPPDQVVFKDIWLSFFYGAKIGIIGSNGTLTGYGGGLDRKTWLLDHERRWSAEPQASLF